MHEVPCWKGDLRDLYVSKNNDLKDYMLACKCTVMEVRYSIIFKTKRPKERDIQFQHALAPSAALAQQEQLTGGPVSPDAKGVRRGRKRLVLYGGL